MRDPAPGTVGERLLSAAFWSKRVEQAIETVGRLARTVA